MEWILYYYSPFTSIQALLIAMISTTQSLMPVKAGLSQARFILPIIGMGLLPFSVSHAEILSSTETRTSGTITKPIPAPSTPVYTDRLDKLIQEKQQAYATLPKDGGVQNGNANIYGGNSQAFTTWLTGSPYRQAEVAAYHRYLQSQLGVVPPMEQLLVSARSAEKCGHEPYEIPPRHLWESLVPTLRLVQNLQRQGYLPYSTVIRSVYRNPTLNRCAGGANESRHMTNGAVDVWIPEYEGQPWRINDTVTNLCYLWQSQGQGYNMGLGLYATGAIHIDTQGWRKWGGALGNSGAGCFGF